MSQVHHIRPYSHSLRNMSDDCANHQTYFRPGKMWKILQSILNNENGYYQIVVTEHRLPIAGMTAKQTQQCPGCTFNVSFTNNKCRKKFVIHGIMMTEYRTLCGANTLLKVSIPPFTSRMKTINTYMKLEFALIIKHYSCPHRDTNGNVVLVENCVQTRVLLFFCK